MSGRRVNPPGEILPPSLLGLSTTEMGSHGCFKYIKVHASSDRVVDILAGHYSSILPKVINLGDSSPTLRSVLYLN